MTAPFVKRQGSLGSTARLIAILVVGVLLAASLGCQTDDNLGGLPSSCLIFTPEKDPTADEVVAQWGSESTCGTAEVELFYSGSLPVWGASFTIEYPSAFTQFVQVETEDGFLFEDGVAPIVNVGEVVSGRAVVGITRTDSTVNSGIVPTTNTLLARLVFFRVTSSGNGDVILTEANLETVATPGDIPAESVPPVPFFGGRFTIEN